MGTTVQRFRERAPQYFFWLKTSCCAKLLRILSKKEDIHVVGEVENRDRLPRLGLTWWSRFSLSRAGGAGDHAPVSSTEFTMRVVMEPGSRPMRVPFPARGTGRRFVGYVLKDASAVEVSRTIRAVAAGDAVCPPVLSSALFGWVARRRQRFPACISR